VCCTLVAPDGLTALASATHAVWPAGPCAGAHPLAHAAMAAIAAVAALNLRALGRDADGGGGGGGGRGRGGEGGAADAAAPAERYLCTGCTAVLTAEPCAMCAMALLHSRIGRVVYARADGREGALGSAHRLHVHRQLNHHFDAYRGLCADEAAEALGVADGCRG
jgi:tRNA-specific adenosine deaminase 3